MRMAICRRIGWLQSKRRLQGSARVSVFAMFAIRWLIFSKYLDCRQPHQLPPVLLPVPQHQVRHRAEVRRLLRRRPVQRASHHRRLLPTPTVLPIILLKNRLALRKASKPVIAQTPVVVPKISSRFRLIKMHIILIAAVSARAVALTVTPVLAPVPVPPIK